MASKEKGAKKRPRMIVFYLCLNSPIGVVEVGEVKVGVAQDAFWSGRRKDSSIM